MTDRLITGHVLDALAGLPADSVQCVMTSPPYWGLRDYGLPPVVWGGDPACEHEWGQATSRGRKETAHSEKVRSGDFPDGFRNSATYLDHKVDASAPSGAFCLRCGAWRGQLGLEPTIDLFVEHIVAVFREVRRVLRKDGVCFVNMGDSYSAHPGQRKATDLAGPKQRSNSASTGTPSRSVSGLKPKDLVGQPWRVAFALQADGWWLRSDIVWAKRNPMPESTDDRPTRSHEMIFLLVKNGCEPIYWTHRDGAGTRSRPEPDYRFVRATGEETAAEPADWRTSIITCPECGGKGRVPVCAEGALLPERTIIGWEPCGCARRAADEDEAGDADPEENGHEDQARPRRGQVWEWKRVNLWQGRPYYWDAEAVREPGAEPERQRNDRVGGATGHLVRHSPGAIMRQSVSRNMRSVWTLATQPTKVKHYATFPDEIPWRCILAGTSARGACPTCGAPWERVVERTNVVDASAKGSRFDKGKTGTRDGGERTQAGERYLCVARGWRPTCECGTRSGTVKPQPPVPCVVLDPFAGIGTTLRVAKELGRDAIGIELSEEYIGYARRLLAGAQQGLRME